MDLLDEGAACARMRQLGSRTPEEEQALQAAVRAGKYERAAALRDRLRRRGQPGRTVSVQDIADTFYISPRHVNRVFEDYFGQSFKRTLNIYRLNYAKNYLLDTDYSTEKIAALVGLSSPKMLYQLFREIEGMTLGEFRAQYGKRSTEK